MRRRQAKSNSSLGGDGYNELRFEDETHKEQLFMHAERNMDVHVKNDSFENILNDRHAIENPGTVTLPSSSD
ncbi:hypothetical protein F0U60_19290 [Archangium minus]|uniref:Gp5/Type VI secretion system Vgr C-terminal trimerisation domain-containing protein n=1 Tax=Archangium minus TaxID=83450 RepID=A0ABY9WRY5_9BACT|nr:hypothetical protein F0U60_19290 [Archangium minus]